MNFCKLYSEFIEREGRRKIPGCTYVQFERFKKILKKCAAHSARFRVCGSNVGTRRIALRPAPSSECEQRDESLSESRFGSLHRLPHCLQRVIQASSLRYCSNEVSAIVGCFNVRAKLLMQRHLAKGMRKYILKLRNGLAAEHTVMIEEGRTLVTYASINAMAIRKILKKYDKVHCAEAEHTFPKTHFWPSGLSCCSHLGSLNSVPCI